MTNPVTPSQFHWTRQAVDTLAELMPLTQQTREVVADQIEHTAARFGKSCIKRDDVYAYFGYCNTVSA